MKTVTTNAERNFKPADPDDVTDEEACAFAEAWVDEVHEGGGGLWKIELNWFPAYANADTSGDKGVLSANWNYVSRETQNLLERAGYSLDWCDAVCSCGGCNKAIQTQPSHYGWKPEYVETDGDILCEECVKDDPSSILDEYRGNPAKALTLDGIDLTDHGYARVETTFENGFHPGQDDDPKAIARALEDRGIEDYIFTVDTVGQFDMRFSVWVSREEAHLAVGVEGKCDIPPNVALDRALKSIPAPTGQGIQYSKVHADGTVTTRTLTNDEFIAGVRE